jgi:hypothetical protein
MKVELIQDVNPFLGRAILTHYWNGEPQKAKKVLTEICQKWPKGIRTKFLITCGGFIQLDLPENIKRTDVPDATDPPEEIVKDLMNRADKFVRGFFDDNLQDSLRNVTDYITLGVDFQKRRGCALHMELVLLAGLTKEEWHWTGKTYPTVNQENGLVRIMDLRSHFVSLQGVGDIMLLGCHDLNIFHNRKLSQTREWRKEIKIEFRKLANSKAPLLVLHHPHSTDSVNVWKVGWSGVLRDVPSVKMYSSSGKYYEPSHSQRSPLDDVLDKTRYGMNTIDFVFLQEV